MRRGGSARGGGKAGRRRRPAAGLLLLALLAVQGGCARDDRPALVLVVMDTTRADHLGCYGHASATTATLDSLARAGVRFAQAVTAVPVTAPAVTTILSGVEPPVHGVRDNGKFRLDEDLPVLPAAFRAAGYRTGAVVGAVPLLAGFGYDRGFEYYDDRFAEDPYPVHHPAYAARQPDLGESERRATAVTDRALAWLEDTGAARPFLLLVHYYDPHDPSDPPPAFRARHRDEPYDGEIAYMDAELGRLLDGARRICAGRRELRVAAIADHGEGLFDHEESTHGFFVYDTTVRVPWIVTGEGATPGLVVEPAVRTVDVAPTLCGWLGIPAWPDCAGRDLSAALDGGPVPAACDTAYLETFMTQLRHDWAPLQGLRTPAWKWIRAPEPELYDLARDPAESHNLARARPDVARNLDALLEARLAAAAAGPDLAADWAPVDPEVERRLTALGYVSGGSRRSVVADLSLPDPKHGNRLRNLALIADAARRERDPAQRAALGLEMVRIEWALGRRDRARTLADSLRADPGTPAAIRDLLDRLDKEADR